MARVSVEPRDKHAQDEPPRVLFVSVSAQRISAGRLGGNLPDDGHRLLQEAQAVGRQESPVSLARQKHAVAFGSLLNRLAVAPLIGLRQVLNFA